jgi:Flp pilus assembly protein TadD
LLTSALVSTATLARGPSRSLEARAVDTAPPTPARDDATARLPQLRAAVDEDPRDRAARFALVRGLRDAGDLDSALAEARAWRSVDAYDLVVVRMLGDLYSELGREDDALRTYSAVTELLSTDPRAQRALATVLKQRGDHRAAQGRLLRAVELAPEDSRLRFELADVELRLGKTDEALAKLSEIVESDAVAEQIRYPAKQRLAQVFAAKRREADEAGDTANQTRWAEALRGLDVKGGVDNDIKIYLSWDTNRTDVDLWVTTPSGARVWYQHKQEPDGALYDDVTNGYGPESFTSAQARPGEYAVAVNYYSTNRSAFVEARGEVTVILDEGRTTERQLVFPYTLHRPGQTVTVARITVD